MTCTPRTPESINPGSVQAGDYLERMVSVYRNSFDTKGEDRTLRSVLEEIRDSKLSHLITEVRQLHQAIPPLPEGLLPDDTKGITKWKAEDPETHVLWHAATRKYSAVKRKLAAFIFAGTFRPYHRRGETPHTPARPALPRLQQHRATGTNWDRRAGPRPPGGPRRRPGASAGAVRRPSGCGGRTLQPLR